MTDTTRTIITIICCLAACSIVTAIVLNIRDKINLRAYKRQYYRSDIDEIRIVKVTYKGKKLTCVGIHHKGDNPSFEVTNIECNRVYVYNVYQQSGELQEVERLCMEVI